MRLILFRHGPAGERDDSVWPDDALRPLSERGIERTHAAAAGLERLEPGVRHNLASPLTRAMMTAEVLAVAFPGVRVETLDALRPGGSYRQILDHLGRSADDDPTVIVGHEPELGKLAGMLAFGAPAALALKKAGACAFEFDGPPSAGAGRLAWFLPPRLLRRQAGHKHRV